MDNKDLAEGSDFAAVEKQQSDLTPEEFPDGPFGSPVVNRDETVQGISTMSGSETAPIRKAQAP